MEVGMEIGTKYPIPPPFPSPLLLLQVQELQAAADHAMMLKFGRIVDLDRLEGLHINKTAEDLRMKIEAVERRRAQTVLDMEVQSRDWGLRVGGWGLGNRSVILPCLPTYSWYCCSVLFSHTYIHTCRPLCVSSCRSNTYLLLVYMAGANCTYNVCAMFASDYYCKIRE